MAKLKRKAVGIQLRIYDKSNGDPSAIYEVISYTTDWETDRGKYLKVMQKLGEQIDGEKKD